MQQDDALVCGQIFSHVGWSAPHILSFCYLQEHPVNFWEKYKYVFVIFRTSSTFFQLFLHLIPFYFFIHYNLVFIHLLVLFIILSFSCLSPGGILQLFMLLHLFRSLSFHQVPNVIFFSIFSKHFFWFSLWLVLSSIIFFLHQLGKNRYGDLLLLSLLAKTSKTVLKIKGGCNTETPLPREQSHLQITTDYLFSSWYTDSPGKPLLLVTFQWDGIKGSPHLSELINDIKGRCW